MISFGSVGSTVSEKISLPLYFLGIRGAHVFLADRIYAVLLRDGKRGKGKREEAGPRISRVSNYSGHSVLGGMGANCFQ